MIAPVPRIVFVCVENSCRSQIAEAFGRLYAGPNIEVYSAGSRPSGQVNPKAIASMKEIGYDLTTLGGIHSPALLLRNGIGAARQLHALGIDVVMDLPGVGANLQNHAILFIAAHLKRGARQARTLRQMRAFLRAGAAARLRLRWLDRLRGAALVQDNDRGG